MHHLKRLFKASAAGKDNLCLCIGDAEFGPPDTPHQGTFSALQATLKGGQQPILKSFYKHSIGCHTYVASSQDGSLNKAKVLGRLERMLTSKYGQIVIVHYTGSADAEGNWVLPQGAGTISFAELRSVWTAHRKHSQRMLIVADCPGSLHWVAKLASLPKSEALQLNMCVQASQAVLGQSVPPGVFSQGFVTYHTALLAPAGKQHVQHPAGSYFCTWGAANLRDFSVQLHFCGSDAPALGGPHGASLLHARISAPSEMMFESEGGFSEGSGSDSRACSLAQLPGLAAMGQGAPPSVRPRASLQVALSTPEVDIGRGLSQGQVMNRAAVVGPGQHRLAAALAAPGRQIAGQARVAGVMSADVVTGGDMLSYGSNPSQEDTLMVAEEAAGAPAADAGTTPVLEAVGGGGSGRGVEGAERVAAALRSTGGGAEGENPGLRRTISAISDSAQEEWAANNRRSDVARTERLARTMGKTGAGGVPLLNNEELGRRLGQEAGWRMRVGRRGAMGGEEDNILDDDADDEGIPSRDSSVWGLPLIKGPGGSSATSPTTASLANQATPNVSTMPTPCPSTAPTRARPASLGGIAGSLAPLNVSPSMLYASALSPVGIGTTSRLARVTSAADRYPASPRPTASQLQQIQQWDLSSELLGLAPTASSAMEDDGAQTSMSTRTVPDGVMQMLGSCSTGPATPTGVTAALGAGNFESVKLPRGLSMERGSNRPSLHPRAAAALVQALQSVQGAQPSNQLLKFLMETSESVMDGPPPAAGSDDDNKRRGRRDGIAGDEASSFLFNDDEEKWRMLQQLVHGVPELCAEVECLRTLESASRSITPLPRHTAAVEPHAGVDGAHAAGGGAAGVRPAAGLRCSTPPLLGHSCRPGGLAAVAEERALSGGLAPDGPAPADGGGPAVPGSREPTASQHDFTLPFSHEELMYGNTRQCVLSTYNVPHDLMVMGTGTQIMNSLLGIHDAQESNSGPLAGLRGEPQPGALVTEVGTDLLSDALDSVAAAGASNAGGRARARAHAGTALGIAMTTTDVDTGVGLLGTVNELLDACHGNARRPK